MKAMFLTGGNSGNGGQRISLVTRAMSTLCLLLFIVPLCIVGGFVGSLADGFGWLDDRLQTLFKRLRL